MIFIAGEVSQPYMETFYLQINSMRWPADVASCDNLCCSTICIDVERCMHFNKQHRIIGHMFHSVCHKYINFYERQHILKKKKTMF